MEGEICSLDPSVSRVRQQVYLLQKEENFVIYKENCNCVEGMMKATLNNDGTPRKHQKYVHEWKHYENIYNNGYFTKGL